MEKIEKQLLLAADMQKLAPPDDELTVLVRRFSDSELSEDELDMLSAAGSSLSYAQFLKKMEEMKP